MFCDKSTFLCITVLVYQWIGHFSAVLVSLHHLVQILREFLLLLENTKSESFQWKPELLMRHSYPQMRSRAAGVFLDLFEKGTSLLQTLPKEAGLSSVGKKRSKYKLEILFFCFLLQCFSCVSDDWWGLVVKNIVKWHVAATLMAASLISVPQVTWVSSFGVCCQTNYSCNTGKGRACAMVVCGPAAHH